ncbi:MAG: CPBP family intramembrane metalloprotease [Chloroflexi bacterium]|nr:CPBP family intramembrane metalloprotease [Chloroflexota bacterium]
MESVESRFEAVPWTVRDVWWGVGFLGIYLVAALFFVPLGIYWLGLTVDVGIVLGLVEALILLPVWGIALKYRVTWTTLGLRAFKREMLGMGCGLMMLSFVFNAVYGALIGIFNYQIQDLTPLMRQISSPWGIMAGGVIIGPFVEEVFFRGFVFAGLAQRYEWKKAAIISSVLFSLVHLQWAAAIPIFFLGYLFAYLYRCSRSLWPAILMHATINFLAFGSAYLLTLSETW